MLTDELQIKVTVLGDCGKEHASFAEWQDCQTCGRILGLRLREGQFFMHTYWLGDRTET